MRIGIFGAGAIGGYLGIVLSAAGAELTLLGRSDLVQARDQIRAAPIGRAQVLPRASMRVVTDAAELAGVDVCLVTVKSKDSDQAGATLAKVLAEGALVVSFQNGLDNPRVLARHLGPRVLPGVVGFNVLRAGPVFRQATKSDLFVAKLAGREATLAELAALARAAGERLYLCDDIDGVVAGKLLLNLNNGVCAATGLGIADSLRSRAARALFARCIREGAAAFRASGVRPGRITIVPPEWIARLLTLPDAVVLAVARSIAGVEPGARSSTLQDLDRRRPTEIDDLNGAIVRLARERGLGAPANEAIVAAVHELERAAAAGERLAFTPAERLLASLPE